MAANPVTWVWDTVWKGRLSAVTSGTTATQYTAYDAMGRVTQSSQNTNGTLYPFSYTYNLAGGLETELYPSGRGVTSCYDAAGRVRSVSGTVAAGATPTRYAGSDTAPVSYAPHGGLQTLLRGDKLTETWSYNNRLQPTAISAGGAGNARSVFGLDLYYCAGKQVPCGTNNGNVFTSTVWPMGVDQNYTYDKLNRLADGREPGVWQETFGYDQFGNRWVDATQTSGIALSAFTATAASNFDGNNRLRLNGAGYDGAGNQVQLGAYGFQWDAEGRMVASSLGTGASAAYVYDGDGRRVAKQGTVFVYDAMGQLAAAYGGTTGGSQSGTCYLTVDHLGSTRAITDGVTGATVERHDYLPFGEELYSGTGARTSALMFGSAGGTGAVAQKFTGKERDSETGLDYFGARYLSSAQGRFTSPDPKMFPHDLTDPQSWNKYGYTRNNPLRYTDPDGQDWRDALAGAFNAFGSDNLFGAGRATGGNSDFRTGQAIGDAVATVQGTVETLAGIGGEVGGTLLDLTGVGALIGVPAQVVSAGAIVQGSSAAVFGAKNLGNAALSSMQDNAPTSSGGKSKPEQIADSIEKGGFNVTANPKAPNQEGNVTISHPNEPGTKLNVRVETHPIPGSGGQPARHANVEVVKPGPKNRPRVVSNEHIDQ